MLPIPFANTYTYPRHSGIDFPVARGTTFRASGSGVVTFHGYTPRAGYTIWVRYDVGVTIGYCHLDKATSRLAAVGSRVSEGTPLGLVGSLGLNSTGPHLHAECTCHGTAAGFWRHFTADRVVGGGAPAGGGVGQNLTTRSVEDIQRRVGATVDGDYGPATTAKVMALQTALGITADGIWGPATDRLAFPPTKPATPATSKEQDVDETRMMHKAGKDRKAYEWCIYGATVPAVAGEPSSAGARSTKSQTTANTWAPHYGPSMLVTDAEWNKRIAEHRVLARDYNAQQIANLTAAFKAARA